MDAPASLRPIAVGATQRHYNAMRNFAGAPVPGVAYGRARDLFRFPNYALFRAFDYIEPILGNLEYGSRGFDLLHFFNAISLGKTPWITTFETSLPRWADQRGRGWAIGFGVRQLARPSCRRLIAMCDAARADQEMLLAGYPDLAAEIAPKVTVLHPPQRVLAEAPREASRDRIRFAIVGAEFFRKGGLEVLRAFDRMLGEGLPLQLTIVSTLAHGDYASRATAADLAEAKRLIARWPDAIVHHERLPNDRVLALFAEAHVGLLPTWGDTYGYSVLEAQASGCPVLTTDLRALPEINDDSCGWVIPVPLTPLRDAVIATPMERKAFSELLVEGIDRAVRAMVADPAGIAARGERALQRIRTQHDPEAHGLKLRAIYDEALT